MLLVNSLIANRKEFDICASEAIPTSSNPLPAIGRVILADSIIFADITVNISVREAKAIVARGEVLIKATGFPGNSTLLTSQSRAFF
jgi:hypothetical protein